ncbi:MAG: C_GCAxxG_C_C family protein [Pirellulales bacterium]|nr:C_GCAxxG_C_C family protein [Pirellulales bacterium]
MSNITRRQVLSVAGLTLGVGGLGVSMDASATDEQSGQPRYVPLSPQDVSRRAYEIYPDGSCMYAMIRSIVEAVAKKDTTAVPHVPFDMFKYGHGGVGGYGAICGTCNGGAAVIGLFHQNKKVRDNMITQLFRWYELTELPHFIPPGTEGKVFPKAKAESILCHVSIDSWCEEADEDQLSKKRKDRCRRMSADMAGKVVELLNAQHTKQAGLNGTAENTSPQPATTPPESCIHCHSNPSTKKDPAAKLAPKSTVKMNCATCHEMKSDHPK